MLLWSLGLLVLAVLKAGCAECEDSDGVSPRGSRNPYVRYRTYFGLQGFMKFPDLGTVV